MGKMRTQRQIIPLGFGLAVSLALFGIAWTVGIGMARAGTFSHFDTDNSGYLSKQELQGKPKIENAWAKIDKNDEGRIDRLEFAALMAE
jgi:hypothetical protein